MRFKELDQGPFRLFGIGTTEAVSCAFQGQQLDLDVAGLKTVAHPNGLFVSHVFVLRPMKNQGRGRLGRDPIQGARDNVLVLGGLNVAPEKKGQDFGSVDALSVGLGKVARAIAVDDASDGARLGGFPPSPSNWG